MKKLLDLFRDHRPDVRLLSEHLDGRLGAPATAVLEDHLASCDACTARLAQLREVRTVLSALPAAEPTRSFRLSPAEARPRQPVRAAQPRWMAGMPAVSAAALLLFAVLVGADLYGAGNGTEFGASSRAADDNELLGRLSGERVPQTAGAMENQDMRSMDAEGGATAADDGRDEAPRDIAAAPTAVAPATGGLPQEFDADPDAGIADDFEAGSPVGVAPPASAPAPEEVLRTAVDDGGIGGLRIAQALVGLIAVAAGAAAGIWWYRGREAHA